MANPALSDNERRDRLRLFRTENVGPVTFRRLLAHFGSAALALSALPELSRRGGRRAPLAPPPAAAAEREFERLGQLGARLIVWGDAEYPAALAAIEDAPPVFAVLGHVHLLARPAVAVVGARNASLNGRRIAEDISAQLGKAGHVVVSGLARGIDAAAHTGALPTGTVAVTAGGIDIIYPEENRALHGRIAAEGAIISEVPPGTVPQAAHFPQRNRIISGLALGCLVVEAALRSGSLITARLAAEQGREVFAIPGSPLDPRARGTNDLIRQGATLAENAADVLGALSAQQPRALGAPAEPPYGDPSRAPDSIQDIERYRKIVHECLGPSPLPVDEIIRRCQLSPAIVSLVLLELELASRLERHPGNQVSLT
ncbi:MAG: DNA-processing protein DprA [Alphaproteobacteria bacterium]